MYMSGKPERFVRSRYRWFYRQHMREYRECLRRANESETATHAQVNEAVFCRFNETRARGLTVHEEQLKDWALNYNREMNGPGNFRASDHWVHKFKKNYAIGGRKITKFVTKAQLDFEAIMCPNIRNFIDAYRRDNYFFPRRLIFNTDQSGFNYEMVDARTLEHLGTRDVIAIVESASKTTHSYTIQPIID